MTDPFLEALQTFCSEEAYAKIKKKIGKPDHLPEDFLDLPFENFVPFVNKQCKTSWCVYDLSQLHEQYGQTFDLSDEFKAQAAFQCHYCDTKIQYGDFVTAEKLNDFVESLYKKQMRKREEFLKKSKKKGLLSGLLKKKGSSKKDKKSVQINLDPSSSDRPPSILKTSKPPGPPSLNSLSDKADRTPNGSSSIKSKSKPSRRASRNLNQRISLILTWKDTKANLANRDLPNLSDFDPKEARMLVEKFLSTSPENIKIRRQTEVGIGSLVEEMPSYSEYVELFKYQTVPRKLHLILLAFWKARLCKDKNKLMSAWRYELMKPAGVIPYYQCAERIVQDRNIVLHNADYSSIVFLLGVDENNYILEYKKSTSKLKFINITGSQEKERTKDEIKVLQKTIEQHFDLVNSTIFDSEFETSKVGRDDISYSCEASFFAHRYLIEKFLNLKGTPCEFIYELCCWIIFKLKLFKEIDPENDSPSPRHSVNKFKFSHRKSSFSIQKLPSSLQSPSLKMKNRIPKGSIKTVDVKRGSNKENLLLKSAFPARLSEIGDGRAKSGSIRKSKFGPIKADSRGSSPSKSVLSPKKSIQVNKFVLQEDDKDHLRKYDNIKKLLWFYYNQDKSRYEILLGKCKRLEEKGIIEYLGIDKLESMPPTAPKSLLKKPLSKIRSPSLMMQGKNPHIHQVQFAVKSPSASRNTSISSGKSLLGALEKPLPEISPSPSLKGSFIELEPQREKIALPKLPSLPETPKKNPSKHKYLFSDGVKDCLPQVMQNSNKPFQGLALSRRPSIKSIQSLRKNSQDSILKLQSKLGS